MLFLPLPLWYLLQLFYFEQVKVFHALIIFHTSIEYCQLVSDSFLKFKVSFNGTLSKATQHNDIASSLNVSISVLCFTEFFNTSFSKKQLMKWNIYLLYPIINSVRARTISFLFNNVAPGSCKYIVVSLKTFAKWINRCQKKKGTDYVKYHSKWECPYQLHSNCICTAYRKPQHKSPITK